MNVELVLWLRATSCDVGIHHQDPKHLWGKLAALDDNSRPSVTSVGYCWFVLHQHRELEEEHQPQQGGAWHRKVTWKGVGSYIECVLFGKKEGECLHMDSPGDIWHHFELTIPFQESCRPCQLTQSSYDHPETQLRGIWKVN